MAVGWVSLLRTVPWATVISSAPLLAEGAKKLWSAVAKDAPPAQGPGSEVRTARSRDADLIVQMQERLATLEAAVAEHHEQMLASAKLIKAMAEQSAELVERVEASRVRLVYLSWMLAAIAALSITALVLASGAWQ